MKLLSWFKNKFSNRKTNLSSTRDNTTQSANEEDLTRLLNEESKKRSDFYYEQHQNKYIGWDPQTDIIETDSSPLTSVEISFLDYIDSKKVHELSLPGYWTYEYNLDFKYVISKLINNGYLIVSSTPDRLERLKVNELKDILRKHNLKVSGKKAELIQRIEENITTEQLSNYFNSHYDTLYYIATPSGKQLIKSQPKSVTKDIDFEDECLQLIEQRDLNGAYKLVCKRESMKQLKRGINVDWDQKFKQGLQRKNYIYQKLIDTNIPEIPSKVLKTAINTYIFCDMLGRRPHPSLFNRLTSHQFSNEATCYLDLVEYEFLKIKADQDIVELKARFPNKRYEVLLADDELVCGICLKFNKKKIPISKAKVGVNFPPFHQGCRCTYIVSF